MGGILGDISEAITQYGPTAASYILDPANLAGTRSSNDSPSEESVGQQTGGNNYQPAATARVSPMGYQWISSSSPYSKPVGQAFQYGQAGPMAPPPPAHWSYDPKGGTSWMTPDKRISADNQYSWTSNAPGAGHGNRI